MSDTLRDQLEQASEKLDLVKTRHLAMLQRTDAGPVVFLFEHRRPTGAKPSLRMEAVVQPHYDVRLNSYNNRLVKKEKRLRYRFTFREPRGNVVFPADSKSGKGSRWSRVDDDFYARLKDHESSAWEELFCSFLDGDGDGDGSLSKSGKG